ncbi:MAG: alpha/beta hydrolase [Hellea sp.]|nr:alpha/beta hydrolase [Hellea sp.]
MLFTTIFAFSVFFLILGLAGAIHTELPRKVRNMTFVYFFFSLPAHLLAMQLLIINIAILVTALTILDHSPWLIGISAVNIFLFGLNLRRSYQGTKVLDQILPGEDYNSFAHFIKGALRPIKMPKTAVKRTNNVAYGDAGKKNLLDIYVPASPPQEPMPVLIHIHGGAWVIGHKDQQGKPLIHHMVQKGWVAVDINYRLGPKNRFPIMIEDVLRAIAWVKANIADYGGDPNFVALTGGSAGGHLTALASLVSNNAEFKPGFEQADCTVDAAVPVYGVYDFLDRTGEMKSGQAEVEAFLTKLAMPGPRETHKDFWNKMTPLGNIHADAPAMFVMHGRHDALAAFKGAEIFVEALRDVSKNEVLFVQITSGQHAYDAVNAPPTPAHVRAIERFLNKIRAEKLGQASTD